MKSPAFFVALDSDRWHLAKIADEVELREISIESVETSQTIMEQIASALADWGYDGSGFCLGLPAEMVLAAPIETTDLPRKRRHLAMVYRLEEQLPFEAERLTVDFLPSTSGKTLGLAVQTDQVREIIDDLSQVGVEVASICPTALLAICNFCQADSDCRDYLIVAGGSHINVFRMIQHQPVAWYTAKPDAAELARRVHADLLVHPTPGKQPSVCIIGSLDQELVDAFSRRTSTEIVEEIKETPLAGAAREAGKLLTGRNAGWVDFRRDQLAATNVWDRLSRHLKTAAVLGLLLQVVLTGMFYRRSLQYNADASQCERDQRALYQKLYPNTAVPRNVRSRLNSELKRITAISGSATAMPEQANALDSLRRVTESLPKNVRLRIVDIRLDANGILIQGQTRSHRDAELIAQSLKRGKFDIAPPRTEHLAKGDVAFTLAGKLLDSREYSGKVSTP